MACDDSVTSPHVRRIRELEAELLKARTVGAQKWDSIVRRAEKAEKRSAWLEYCGGKDDDCQVHPACIRHGTEAYGRLLMRAKKAEAERCPEPSHHQTIARLNVRCRQAEAELKTFYDEGCWRNRAVSAEARVAELEELLEPYRRMADEVEARAEKAEGRLQDEVLQQQQDLQRAIRAEARVAELLREVCPRHAEGYHSVRCVRIDEAREKEPQATIRELLRHDIEKED